MTGKATIAILLLQSKKCDPKTKSESVENNHIYKECHLISKQN